MTPLLLSILSSALIYLVFKLLGKYKINTLHTLIFNYLTAFGLGILLYSPKIGTGSILSKAWLPGAVVVGVLFITVFYLMILTTRRSGMSVVAVASKMSVVLSIVFVVFYFKEEPGLLKIFGILLGLAAVYLVSVKSTEGIKIKKSDLLLPFLVFVGSGIVESSIKFLEATHVSKQEVALFSAVVFLVAAILGILVALIRFAKKKGKLSFKAILGGIFLGVPNFGSIFFFIKALRSDVMSSSTVFILNNVAIVLVSTFLGILLFKEKLTGKNWTGIALAVASIVAVALSIYN